MHDLAAAPWTSAEPFDVCIAGAGAAGIVLALELLRSGRRVILLEGGGMSLEESSQDLYRGDVTGQPHTGIHTGRFRTWGGTTTRWGGQILELQPIDFSRREWIAQSGWPIPKEALEEGYRAALEMEGLQGALHEDRAVWSAVGEQMPKLGSALEPYFTRWCPQPDFAVLHGGELSRASNLTALFHANVVDFVISEDTSRIAEVVCRSLNGNQARVQSREFVLAIGSIETSRLLLNLEERKGSRWNPNGLVGCGFQDHIDCEIALVKPLNRARFFSAFTNIVLRGYKYHPKFRLAAEEQRRLLVLNVAGTIAFRDDTGEIASSLKATGRKLLRRAWGEIDASQLLHLAKHVPLLIRQTWFYLVRHRVYNDPSAELSLRVHCEQQPDTVSRIRLADDRDALGMRRIKLDWQVSALELRTMRSFVEATERNLRDCGLAEVVPQIDLHDDSALRALCDDGLHHMGGTAMSADARHGVVDTELRMHGFANLSICSASVFSTGGFSNPTHTVLALAVRLAKRLAVA